MISAEIHTLTGAYVLDAVTDPERAEFDRHLRECPACDLEVGELRETAARLGSAAAQTPPASLFDRVMAEVAQTRQQPPVVSDLLARTARTPRRWVRRAAIGVASLAAVAAALVGGITIGHDGPAQVAGGTSAVSAADRVTTTASGVRGGSATVSLSRSQGSVVVDVQDLPALDPQHAYQVWLAGPGGPRSAGLLDAGARSGTVAAALPSGADRVKVTVEPAGGSPRPTTAEAVAVALS
jgi:anti-sigma factor RsiW